VTQLGRRRQWEEMDGNPFPPQIHVSLAYARSHIGEKEKPRTADIQYSEHLMLERYLTKSFVLSRIMEILSCGELRNFLLSVETLLHVVGVMEIQPLVHSSVQQCSIEPKY
jgi:hypothetical protein